jgi:hypothetical protein
MIDQIISLMEPTCSQTKMIRIGILSFLLSKKTTINSMVNSVILATKNSLKWLIVKTEKQKLFKREQF